jgi:hypothetical protein
MLLGHLPPSPAALLASPSGPDSPLGTYLRDPGGTLRAVLTDVAQWGTIWGPVAGPALAFAAAGLGWARWWWRRRCRRMLNADARIVIVLPPPTADPAGAEALWANLLGLLRPAWRRRLTGQPHLAWEYSFDRETIRIRLWVPGVVPPGMVERAIEAAWPGARTRTAPAAPPTLSAGPHSETAGGELRLARPEALPIRTTFPADPIRALLGAPVGLGAGEQAVVQVLARPVTGRRIAKARRAARRARAGHSVHPISRLLDVLTPGYHPPRSRRTAPVPDRQTALEASAEDKVIVAKQRGAQYETRIRYAITTTVPDDASSEQRAAVRERLRGRATRSPVRSPPSPSTTTTAAPGSAVPVVHLAERRLGPGRLALHPGAGRGRAPAVDEAIPGLQRAGARAVPPPPGIATTGPAVRPIGLTDSGHPARSACASPDARHHLHILGATGSGKSELMARMILADAEAGRGLVVSTPRAT